MDALKSKCYIVSDNKKNFIIRLVMDWDVQDIANVEKIIDHSKTTKEMFRRLDIAGLHYNVFLETNKSIPEIIDWTKGD